MLTLQSGERSLDLSVPVVMGILNATPDSFYNKGRDSDIDSLLRNAEKMLKDGAAILDIGGASTKPGQKLITTEEETERVLPAIRTIHRYFPEAWLSIDTYNAATATACIADGAAIVNDVSGGRFDMMMYDVVAALNVPYIAMHMQGSPETMQQAPEYTDVVQEVYAYLEDVCQRCAAKGISNIIIDPGFGFGKTVAHNYALLNALNNFRVLEKPVLAGLSRKSMICKVLKTDPEHALNGTTALNMVALQNGADILRVHDVKEAIETIKLYTELKNAQSEA